MAITPYVTEQLYAGDTFRLALADSATYPHALGWALTVQLIGPWPVTLTASHDPQLLGWSVVQANTASWQVGTYRVLLVWTHATLGRDTVELGRLEVRPSATTPQAVDVLSQAERIVAAIDQMMLGKASDDVKELEIAGRRLETFAPSELLAMRDKYNAMALRERARGNATLLPRRIVPRWRA